MNNSKLAINAIGLTLDHMVDKSPALREREGELISIIDALQGIGASKEWSTLKEKVFDSLTTTLSNELNTEAKRDSPDTLKLNRLAGQLKWAEKYADLSKLENLFRIELTQVRKLLYGKTQN